MGQQPGFQTTPSAQPRPWLLKGILSLIGFTAVTAQIVAMRELIVVFYGNELSLGIMLANWLLWTALGASLVGRLTQRVRDPRNVVAALEVLVGAAFPLMILEVRASKQLFNSLPGEILGPGPMFLTSLLTLSIFCLLSGTLFSAGSYYYAAEAHISTAGATGNVYLWEAVGSGLGGILASLVFIRSMAPFQIALLVGLVNLIAAVAVYGFPRRATSRRLLAGGLLCIAALLPLTARRLESWSLSLLWRGWHLVETRNSIYGNLAVVEAGESRSLFENGLRALTVPDPSAAEEAVHFALLEHPSPKNLLLIGGGVNGSLAQALQHASLHRVDYVELDPAILDLAAQNFGVTSAVFLADPRVRVHRMDGRLFLKTADVSYDVIIVNLPDPCTAQLNRFYTEEFFREAAQKLNPDGIFSFDVTSSENYISNELADFLRCLLKTLRSVFSETAVIPGDTAHFFAARKAGVLAADSSRLLSRLRARGLRTSYVREYYIPFRLSPDRLLDLKLQIEPQPETPINRDFTPIAYYFDVALWSARFHPGSQTWFGYLARLHFGHTLGGLAVLLLLLVAVPAVSGRRSSSALRERRCRKATAGLCVAAMGFTLLGLEIVLLIGFQALYGFVYHQLAILVALFMLGMAAGTKLGSRTVASSGDNARPLWLRLLILQILAAASPLVLYGLFTTLGHVRGSAASFLVSQLLFPILAFLCGAMGGYQFPLAAHLYFRPAVSDYIAAGGVLRRDSAAEDDCRHSQSSLTSAVGTPRLTSAVGTPPLQLQPSPSSASPGALYALDLIGACLGAVALSTFLIPVYGFLRAAVFMAVVNLAPAVLAGLGEPKENVPKF